MKADAYYPLYGWLLITGLVFFGAFLVWEYGFWHQLLEQDKTKLSSIILIIFALASLYLGNASIKLSRERNKLQQSIVSNGWGKDYLELLKQASSSHQAEPIQARLIEQVHANHSSGWFISDVLLRLGLIGTVIGFVLMLGSVSELQSDGTQALKQLMTSMSSGMQVALYTTLTGLSSAMLLGLQCHWLDRSADQFISKAIARGVEQTTTDYQNGVA